jgi:CBS domain-containing protein
MADIDRLKVADLMTTGVVACPGDSTLATMAHLLARRHIHAVFVLDEAGNPSGIVSDFDLLGGEWMADDPDSLRAMQQMTAAELMTAPIETIRTDASAADAAARMLDLHVSRLLVTDERDTPTGVISVSDLVAPLGRPSGRRRRVRDVMSHALVTCQATAPLDAAAHAMSERRTRSVVVVDDTGKAVEVITGNDLLRLYEPEKHARLVSHLMTTPAITCDPDVALSKAVDLMIKHEVHRLVVIDHSTPSETPIGILSAADVVAEMADQDSDWQR